MKLSKKKLDFLREWVNYYCEECHKHEKKVGKLESHRIQRGNLGGKYHFRNIKMVCRECHKLFHANEFNKSR